MKKVALIDIDGVALDYLDSMDGYVALMVDQKDRGSELNVNTYNLGERYDIRPSVMSYLMRSFEFSIFYQYMRPFKDAQTYLSKFSDYDDLSLIAVTACSNDSNVLESRQTNLDTLFGYGTFDQLLAVGLGNSKKEIFHSYGDRIEFIVEDHTQHLLSAPFQLKQNQKFLITHPYNANYNEDQPDGAVTRVSDWAEVWSKVNQARFVESRASLSK